MLVTPPLVTPLGISLVLSDSSRTQFEQIVGSDSSIAQSYSTVRLIEQNGRDHTTFVNSLLLCFVDEQ